MRQGKYEEVAFHKNKLLIMAHYRDYPPHLAPRLKKE